MVLESVNWLAVLIAAVANMILGMLWYGPILGKSWMKAVGIPKKKLEKIGKENMPFKMILAFLSSIVIATVISIVIPVTALTIPLAIYGAIILWAGFILTTSLNYVLWEGKSWSLYVINVAYYLVSLTIITIILTVMP